MDALRPPHDDATRRDDVRRMDGPALPVAARSVEAAQGEFGVLVEPLGVSPLSVSAGSASRRSWRSGSCTPRLGSSERKGRDRATVEGRGNRVAPL